ETYTYDSFGNLRKRTITSVSPNLVFDVQPSQTNNRMQMDDGTGHPCAGCVTYDEAGNMTKLSSLIPSMTYDPFNEMTSKSSGGASQDYIIYTASDERLAVQGGGAVHWTLRDFDGKSLRQFDSVPLESASWGSQ